jgi:hypothetical protein
LWLNLRDWRIKPGQGARYPPDEKISEKTGETKLDSPQRIYEGVLAGQGGLARRSPVSAISHALYLNVGGKSGRHASNSSFAHRT